MESVKRVALGIVASTHIRWHTSSDHSSCANAVVVLAIASFQLFFIRNRARLPPPPLFRSHTRPPTSSLCLLWAPVAAPSPQEERKIRREKRKEKGRR
ncbi:Os08g0488950 [Oryza sativa Japonica Group]|jgi:hypothetical protein|nr:Os08g0488950 [Oryza sativa Japonica Group]